MSRVWQALTEPQAKARWFAGSADTWIAMAASRIQSFPRFYEYYLGEHRNPTCRLLHFIGSWLVLAIVLAAIVSRRPLLLVAAPVAGYGFAWAGHFFFEKNRPATFRQPWYSLAGDWVLWWQITTGRRSLSGRE